MTEDLEVATSDPFARVKNIEEVGLLNLKGYKNSEICEVTGFSPQTVREYINIYKGHIQKVVDEDPYFLENVQYNTLRTMAEMDEISKEAWESVDIATRDGMLAQRNQALKLALDVASKKAQLLQLMGGSKGDGEYIARMQKAETVNSIIAKVIRDVVGECPVCRDKAKVALREAFAMMDQEDEFMTPDAASDKLDFTDAEVVDES